MSKKATIIAVVNQKGGTGKTTTTENLGVGLALEGKKVLLVDTDPQASLTVSLGNPYPDDLSPTLSDLMGKIMMEKPIAPGEGILHHPEGVDLVPANIELSGMEVALVNAMSRETILRQYLDTVKQNYDYILLDCMPSLGMLTVNALAAADNVLIPVQAAYLPAKGLEQLLETVNKVKRQINPKLRIEGILLTILQQITDWLKEMLISAIMGNLSGMFESVNNQVGEIATSVGRTPESFSPEIFAMVRNISESVIIPIAGLILTFIACYELIQLIIDHNNLANFETWIFFKWVFKTFVAVMLITNTFNITMAVFDVAQHVVNASGGIIAGNTAIDASGLEALEETLQGMDLGPLIGLLLQSFVEQITMSALAIIIFVIVYGRMIEIYLMVSLAPIPFSTFANREQNQIGQNYLRSLFALGFQGFLIIICVGIYAVLVQSLAFTDDIIADIWGIMGYTVLLCFTLFKTGTLAKSVFNAH